LESRVQCEGIEALFTTCPEAKCSSVVGEDMFKLLLAEPLFTKYKAYLVRSYIEKSTSVKWCPARGCDQAIEYPKDKPRTVLCKCGSSWCFKCCGDAHQPISCEDLTKWKLKSISDTEGTIEDWLLVNTKRCPGCQKYIQKNQGCMHMTCKCGHQFCWLCLGCWTQHGSDTGGVSSCNRFTAMRDAGDLRDEERERFWQSRI
jgi:ariadne-1